MHCFGLLTWAFTDMADREDGKTKFPSAGPAIPPCGKTVRASQVDPAPRRAPNPLENHFPGRMMK